MRACSARSRWRLTRRYLARGSRRSTSATRMKWISSAFAGIRGRSPEEIAMSSDVRTTGIAACSAVLAFGIAVAGLTTPAAAQAVPALKVKPANATHPQEFTSVSSMRELSDGRVIVTDRGEQRLFVLDFATGEATEFGRKGSGPEE